MNLGNTDHALIYPKSDAINKKSSVIYKEYIFSTGTILTNLIRGKKKLQKNVENHLTNNRVIIAKDKAWSADLQSETFIVIQENKNKLVQRPARLKYIFNSLSIHKSIKEILSGFRSYKVPFDQIDLHQLLVSSFVILEFCDNRSVRNDESFIEVMTKDANLKGSLNKLDTVVCVTTPFAHESFFKTVNVSKVANIFGSNNCLSIISAPLVYGCEGGGVYDSSKKLIGIVINTTFCWNNETAILSLVADYRNIAREFVQIINPKLVKSHPSEPSLKCQMQRSVVLIQSGGSWGTGCLLKMNDSRMVITCSHIITVEASSTVACFWNKTEFASKVIYKNPKYNHAYDIAILSVPESIPNNVFAQHAADRPGVGDIVYSVGFPYFSTLATKIDSPSIYDGRITKLSKGMIMTDVNVQAGQSGCPLFSEEKKLFGVCISNSKDSAHNLVYPNISMVVPIADIISILNDYSLLGDERVLNQLEASNDVSDVWQLNPPKVISKL